MLRHIKQQPVKEIRPLKFDKPDGSICLVHLEGTMFISEKELAKRYSLGKEDIKKLIRELSETHEIKYFPYTKGNRTYPIYCFVDIQKAINSRLLSL